ncbi:hypothetical protein E5675_04895 [Sphingopyxis sp. PAMC25046]|uniref:DUF6680 family protein n=1 Tax=Sphingopyxis sp. PAMC25046 TaxID=2565556 RepID=UPI00109DA73D|nr:DUF6680 family protein [Sphingopyxis sp. PAMC25046]QCB53833.1 hypothetical protein E5675_04895 [Sphingopyxis sp. PAMC25046]
MSTAELISLAAILIGPIAAVLISVWLTNNKQERDQRLIVLRMLLSTRHLPSDPGFSVAINLVPVEFNKSPKVMAAYREFIHAVQNPENAAPETPALQSTAIKTTKLIFEIVRDLGFNIQESDIQHAGYAASGFIERDNLFLDSQRAMRNVADILWIQTRLLAGESWESIQSSPTPKVTAESGNKGKKDK